MCLLSVVPGTYTKVSIFVGTDSFDQDKNKYKW